MPSDVHRPSDLDLLRAAVRSLAARSGIRIVLAGLVTESALTITESLGTTTDSLHRLYVRRGEGIGGGAMARGEPTVVADYIEAPQISHHHDHAVAREGLRSMIALPVLVQGDARAILYAANRDPAPLGERVLDEFLRGARRIALELHTRDEVDRRVAILRGSEPATATAGEHELREALRIAHGELIALASTTQDAELARSILAVTEQLSAVRPPAPDAPKLTRRELDVLAQVALGCSYPEAARRLGLQAGTVKSYMQTITTKLGAHSRHEAVATARRLQLIP